jgi:phytoene dehydrogenase-like protein
MAQWDAIVVGSGLGGLAAGAALARARRRVLVLERQENFGGAATLYRHGRMTMEASLHAIDEEEVLSPHGALPRLGVSEGLELLRPEEFYEVRSSLFSPLSIPHGLDAMAKALLKAFPTEQTAIERYERALRRLHRAFSRLQASGAESPAPLIYSAALLEIATRTRLTVLGAMQRLFHVAEAPKLAICAPLLYLDDQPSETSFLAFAAIMSRYLESGSIYLRHGSRAIPAALLATIEKGGGEARRRRFVTRILLDAHGAAAGVAHRGEDGEEVEEHAPIVFGNAAPAAIAEMLPSHARASFQGAFDGLAPSISLFTVALGLDRRACDFGVSAFSTFIYPDWMTRLDQYGLSADAFAGPAGAMMPFYALVDYSRLGPFLGQPGDLYQLAIAGVDRLWSWEGLSEAQYRDRRERWIDAFIADLERRYPGIAGAVQQREMATARTMKNRLGTPHGEVYGFKPTCRRLFGRKPSAATPIPGLYIASAHTAAGGYAGALNGGLMAAAAALKSAGI